MDPDSKKRFSGKSTRLSASVGAPPKFRTFPPDFALSGALAMCRIKELSLLGRAVRKTSVVTDPSNFRAAYWATVEQSHPVGGGSNWTFDLFIDDDTLIGRGGVIVTYVVMPQNFHAGSEIVLRRVDAKTAPPGRKVY